jgi:hypothetical protein
MSSVGIFRYLEPSKKSGIFAENFFLDYFPDMLQKESDAIFKEVGDMKKVHEMIPKISCAVHFK